MNLETVPAEPVETGAQSRAKTPVARLWLRPVFLLPLVAMAAVLVHGYHLGADDAAIDVPAIKRAANPSLYPFGSEFFMSHAHLSLFAALVGGSARLARLPIDLVIFVWHALSILALLAACWRLTGACFSNLRARWGAVALLAGALSVPVAGTSLVIMDPYITARSLSTPFTIFAVACYVSNRRKEALAWLLATAVIHPQMSVYGAVFLGLMELGRRSGRTRSVLAFGLLPVTGFPLLFQLEPVRGAAREAMLARTYFFPSNWAWYEWIGVFAPLALLWWLARANPRGVKPAFRPLAGMLVPFGALFTVAWLTLNCSPKLENLDRLQPMRSFHLVYVIFFAVLGGLVSEYALKTSVRRWLLLFVPLAASMWLLQRSEFPFSPHVEWPGERGQGDWMSAFLWIRHHTPENAVFALDPNHMLSPGEDQHGFRAVAERSMLADNVKDSGAVSLFPQLARDWKSQVSAESGWAAFQLADFRKLARRFPVSWVVTTAPAPAGLVCPYENAELAVCRLK